ncbi:MAG: acetate--CoA ligase family protein, partial [candidate division NC10 bacterium]|nr:acetate--CoA ligase family protein [candidate division NC10 bacterium]
TFKRLAKLLKELDRTSEAIQTLEEALLRVSALAEDLPQVAELDLNPIRVHPKGGTIVDARVRVSPFEPPPMLGRDG